MTAAARRRNIKLMADYECFPLWERLEGSTCNVDPADLPITLELQGALDLWAERYDNTLDRDDPRNSGFQSLEAESVFRTEGEALLEKLRVELGQDYTLTLQV